RESLASAAAVSAGLAGATCTVTVVVGLMLVVPVAWRATNPRHVPATALRVAAAGVGALPEFVLAAVLLTLVAVRWRLAPAAAWSAPPGLPRSRRPVRRPAGGYRSPPPPCSP